MMTEAVWQMIFEGIWETLYMTILSTVIAYIFGLPLGILLSVTGKGGILRNRAVNGIIGAIVNILRSVPFLILLVVLIPFTRLIVGTSLGTTARIIASGSTTGNNRSSRIYGSVTARDHSEIHASRGSTVSASRLSHKPCYYTWLFGNGGLCRRRRTR